MNGIEQRRLNKQLFAAVREGDVNRIVRWIKAGADVNYYTDSIYGTVLCAAVNDNLLEIVQMLLAHGAKPNGNPNDMIRPIFLCNNDENGLNIAKELLDHGAYVNVISSAHEVPTDDDKANTPLKFHIKDGNFELAKLIVQHIAKREVAGLDVSQENLELKNKLKDPSQQEDYNSDIASRYKESFDKCKEEVKKLGRENKPLHDFLQENNINKLISIWEKNENVRNKFDDSDSLKEQYPEYACMLINKANDVKEKIFLHNHLPFIKILSEHYKPGNPDNLALFDDTNFAGIRNFLNIHENDFKELKGTGMTLMNFVRFDDVETRHDPETLKVRVFKQMMNNFDNTKTEQHQANKVMSNLDKIKTELRRAWPCTIL
ncbi:ankyrin repeat domain-containing protein [Wolbachia endosymbiont of Folsomia candida]|uniref:ankyrin repeat domain-containing protein n=1 Tax=Wolbachia endosymbiont of Folsomia candida TaxID=169402 RepID=UPI000AD5EB52|nr:ankyrin repeat domain-containing protein [Wolbachia endosymbiont of Folsomia candida]APR98175.1 hypothetical protein ASM33_02580 [Wolbachia endosymbiont of Folsomia candida]